MVNNFVKRNMYKESKDLTNISKTNLKKEKLRKKDLMKKNNLLMKQILTKFWKKPMNRINNSTNRSKILIKFRKKL